VKLWSRKLYEDEILSTKPSDWEMACAMGTFPADYKPLPEQERRAVDPAKIDEMSVQIKGARRVFLSLFSPADLDFAKMVQQSEGSGAPGLITMTASLAHRKAFEQQWRATPPGSGSYRVLFGALSCGVHTPMRTKSLDSP
jgi:hypothetical protein